eukprot:6082485-Pleurochrysis_carterae.AAC.3
MHLEADRRTSSRTANGARRAPAISRTTRSTREGHAIETLAGQGLFPTRYSRTSNKSNESRMPERKTQSA